ncbi:hypothetical protein TWF706_007895 [Orbilia oligospora]|uniref:Neutral ceramidase n=1 Tax=Orbilia oligospora TaxID=2813651 RepID=A0A7C8P1I0_ORBOL|nr:hypothetical protein TWF706_007895 [Orbilia oligospora]KAF3141755.1 hypothetical protein TWF703_001777 [Orbilia oligospora]
MKPTASLNLRTVVAGCLVLLGTVLLWHLSHLDQHIFEANVLRFKTSDSNSPVSSILQNIFHNVPAAQITKRQVYGQKYLIGVGKADITGPVVEINFMGYANGSQVGTGLRQRLYSRAFIIGSVDNPADRFVYLVIDTACGDTALRYGVLKGLAALGGGFSVYKKDNVALTGTHSHAGPGAFMNYLLPQVTSKGFDKQSYQAIVDGTILSIKRAHESLAEGYLTAGSTELQNAAINRSPSAYLANSAQERAKYNADVDKTLTMLRFTRASDKKNIGVLTWYSVHGTSMLGNNTIVSGDNKGVAAYLFETSIKGLDAGNSGFVAGFSQASVGDTTPNTEGAYCENPENEGQLCTFDKSTCGGKSQPCHGRGPLFRVKDNGASSCYEIGRRQAQGALDLYNSLDKSGTPIKGSSVKSFHTFVDFSKYSFQHPNGTTVRTCPAALGYSFAAGTSDGPGAFDFTQSDSGDPDANPVWKVVSGLLKAPGPEQKSCQWPKPILLDVGEMHFPYDWTANIADIQMLRVGQFIAIISPGEATTMSGRRWKEAVAKASTSVIPSGSSPIVVLGGPANTYTHYITTEEEYNVQRYEGASTLYGPHTLNAYISLTLKYLPFLSPANTKTIDPGPSPPDNSDSSLNFITGVVYDNPPIFKSFGQITTDAAASYRVGDTATVVFIGANPRNNLRLEDTFAAVEFQKSDGSWIQVRNDEDWDLIYNWRRDDGFWGSSSAIIQWVIGNGPKSVQPGKYRIKYYGDSKAPVTGKISGFTGTSREFDVFSSRRLPKVRMY